MRYRNTYFFILALILLTAWSATIYTQANSDRVNGGTAINKVYQTILDRYVAEIDPEKLSNAAIDGMLHELDPYSQHINDNDSYRLDAITTGEYGGVGIHLGRMNDSLVVVSPMDGTPAFRQGIQSGDRIVKIDSVWTRKLDLNQAARLVRGEKGSLITLYIKRDGEPKLLTFEITRELIKVPDVSYSGLLDNRTGYVKLSNFSKFSAEDLEKAIRKLNKTGLNALIIDLRGNPGGLLSAALMSADLFVGKGELLLETKGRINQSNKKYNAKRNPIVKPSLPMAVLVDGGSASASEILSGILQDYDRAVVIGEPSYGKGLVQTVTRLTPESRLKLTTAKYYLPSGRLIQKRDIATDVIYEDLLETENNTFYSDNHRQFEAGGGVTPDLLVEDLPLSELEKMFWRNRLFFKYALDYTEANPGLSLPLNLNDDQVDHFYSWLEAKHMFPQMGFQHWLDDMDHVVDSTSTVYEEILNLRNELQSLEALWQQEEIEQNRDQILSGLETEISNVIGGNGARIAASLKHDPVVNKAIELLASRPEMLSILTGKED
ncbi:S41 family peptidase [bacterium]|nr:S41 family peptidase [bacterium]